MASGSFSKAATDINALEFVSYDDIPVPSDYDPDDTSVPVVFSKGKWKINFSPQVLIPICAGFAEHLLKNLIQEEVG